MAKKKKTEVKVEEEQTEPNLEDASFIPFENGMPNEPITLTQEDLKNEATTTVTFTNEPEPPTQEKGHDYISKISRAFDAIERCNLYMWAGLDWGAGRIYEMSRKEWANYILAMYDWSDNDFEGDEPEMPVEVKYD